MNAKEVTELPNCAGCHKDISGAATIAGDNKYHPECFKCTMCSTPIQGSYGMLEGKVHCKDCQKKAFDDKKKDF